MPVRIKSLLTSGPLWVPLTSGTSLRLSPGQLSPETADVEVQGNQAVDSLVGRGIIQVLAVPKTAAAAKKTRAKEEAEGG
ncbi:hypothetical protein LVY72_10975 [Arthrobacter sp. I2-34]|uniref:Uncharacterized protein n=1 Tax=Arthrobacter hankyongi TaxID=2904801 RepID=A0ABS9L6Y6_9MICC|nr:hypothetical protein [Arthrobacter hankyongi]MCG2622435.1 hypothetical protein [Arthrobacter hankyongi]